MTSADESGKPATVSALPSEKVASGADLPGTGTDARGKVHANAPRQRPAGRRHEQGRGSLQLIDLPSAHPLARPRDVENGPGNPVSQDLGHRIAHSF